MKQARHRKICELISENNIETQEELALYLRKCGFDVTQATVSRDIKALKLIKTLADNGSTYRYTVPGSVGQDKAAACKQFLSDMILSVSCAGNLVVVKTLKGAAKIVSETLQTIPFPEVLGDIAGYDTVFIAVSSNQSAQNIRERLMLCASGKEEEL